MLQRRPYTSVVVSLSVRLLTLLLGPRVDPDTADSVLSDMRDAADPACGDCLKDVPVLNLDKRGISSSLVQLRAEVEVLVEGLFVAQMLPRSIEGVECVRM